MSKFFRNIIIAALAFCPAAVSANPLIGDANYDFIRNAIAPSLRIVHSTYDVASADLSNRFCAQGDSVYGHSFSLAVISDRGILLSPTAGRPWDFDKYFVEISNDPQYTALNRGYYFSLLSNPAQFTKAPLDEFSVVLPAYNNAEGSLLYIASTETDLSNKALLCGDFQGKLDGFAVWVVNPANNNIVQNADIFIKIAPTPITLSDSPGDTSINPVKTQGTIIGGVYLVPVTLSPGVIQFQVAGLIVPSSRVNQPWCVVKIPQQ
ncbi:MAG: hypothetical protein ACI31C_06630 [Muribaculaceae bacterium]